MGAGYCWSEEDVPLTFSRALIQLLKEMVKEMVKEMRKEQSIQCHRCRKHYSSLRIM